MYEQSELSEVLAKTGSRLRNLADLARNAVDGRKRMELCRQIEQVGADIEDIAEQHARDEDTEFFDVDAAEFLTGDDGRPEAPPATPKQPKN